MKVKVMNRLYQMSKTEYEGVLRMASEQVPFGIYALEKKEYAELRNDHCKSITHLKNTTKQFKQQGYRVLSNGR